jgi:hypothetical protein
VAKISCFAIGLSLIAGCASTEGGDGTFRISRVVEGSAIVHETLTPNFADHAIGGVIGATTSLLVRDANSGFKIGVYPTGMLSPAVAGMTAGLAAMAKDASAATSALEPAELRETLGYADYDAQAKRFIAPT